MRESNERFRFFESKKWSKNSLSLEREDRPFSRFERERRHFDQSRNFYPRPAYAYEGRLVHACEGWLARADTCSESIALRSAM